KIDRGENRIPPRTSAVSGRRKPRPTKTSHLPPGPSTLPTFHRRPGTNSRHWTANPAPVKIASHKRPRSSRHWRSCSIGTATGPQLGQGKEGRVTPSAHA